MFGFLKRRREKRARLKQLQELGRTLGESLNAEVALFIEMEVVPRRKAFIEVLHGQMAQIDQRLEAAEAHDTVSRDEAAAIDVRIMMDNWDARAEERLASARQWLEYEYELAEAAGVQADFDDFVQRSLTEQRLILLTDGMAAINEVADGKRSTAGG